MTIRSSQLTKPKKVAPTECIRCRGNGIFGNYGTCFRCGGSGQDPTHREWAFPTSWSNEEVEDFHTQRLERNRRARERRAEKQAEKALQTEADNLAAHPELEPILERYRNNEIEDPFVSDVLSKVRHFPLSDKQVSAVVKAVSDLDAEAQARAERLAQVPPIEEGTFDLVGEVVSIKWQDNQWGGQMKQLVELDSGQRLFGTQPSSLDEAQVGDRVSFTATVSPSTDDPTFGFYSRPRKGQIL